MKSYGSDTRQATTPKADGERGHKNRPVRPPQNSFELKLTGPAVVVLAGGMAALLYTLAERLGGGG